MKNETKYIGVFEWWGDEYAALGAGANTTHTTLERARKGQAPEALYDTPSEALDALSKSVDRSYLRGPGGVSNLHVEEVEVPVPGLEVGDEVEGHVELIRNGDSVRVRAPGGSHISICSMGLYNAMGIQVEDLPNNKAVRFGVTAVAERVKDSRGEGMVMGSVTLTSTPGGTLDISGGGSGIQP